MFVISQYFSSNLNSHIRETFPLDPIQGASLELLSPEETPEGKIWYQGTADAIRKNLQYILKAPSEYFLILSGDQLYNMDLYSMITFAKEQNADLTIASLPVGMKEACRMGIMKLDENDEILDFIEKTSDPEILKDFILNEEWLRNKKTSSKEPLFLGSMGIYLFKKQALIDLLEQCPGEDFGKHLIPEQMKRGKTISFFYGGYWEDIGTIASFYEANLALTTNNLGMDFYDETHPIIAHQVHLPCARIIGTKVTNSILCQGSIIQGESIANSIIGLRSVIKQGSIIESSILMGNQYYETPIFLQDSHPNECSIGVDCHIRKAIIDEHVMIGDRVKLINQKNLQTFDGDGLYVRDGIIIVTSGTVIPNDFVF